MCPHYKDQPVNAAQGNKEMFTWRLKQSGNYMYRMPSTSARTAYSCVPCDSQNKQKLLPVQHESVGLFQGGAVCLLYV
jgi:hypothetical protein